MNSKHLKPFDGKTAWLMMLSNVFNHGVESSPRNIKTKELLCYTSAIDMNHPIVSLRERNVSYSFLFAEAWWILSGRNDVEFIEQYAPSIGRFSDNEISFTGAYGPKFISQVDYAVHCLIKDPDSRQSIINIWTPNPPLSKDIPCTISLQFLIRQNKIHCVANMRSSDAWIGFIYDIFNFSCISTYIAILLKNQYPNIKLGTLLLNCGSQHIYENNFQSVEKVLNIHNNKNETSDDLNFYLNRSLQEFDNPLRFLQQLKTRAEHHKQNKLRFKQ